MERNRIVAVGLLTKRDVALLGPTFDRIWPVEEFHADVAQGASEHDAERFAELLRAIDEADRTLGREPERAPERSGPSSGGSRRG